MTDRPERLRAKSLVRLARTRPGMRPAVRGGSTFTREEEDTIDQFVRSLRSRKFLAPPDSVMIYADHLILATDVRREELSREGFSKGIWAGLNRRLPMHTFSSRTATIRPIGARAIRTGSLRRVGGATDRSRHALGRSTTSRRRRRRVAAAAAAAPSASTVRALERYATTS